MPLSSVDTDNDTIAAISTPIGVSGFGVVRLSGKKAVEIAFKIFKPVNPGVTKKNIKSYTVHYGYVYDGDKVVDEVLLSIYLAPKSFTREDVAEISAHGGIVSLQRILQLCLTHGARVAQPGEFTKRAFINGRISLDQAEAVYDIITSRTIRAQELAVEQLTGRIGKTIYSFREQLLTLLSRIEADLDFAEEEHDIVKLKLSALLPGLRSLQAGIKTLISSYATGRVYRNGIKLAIVGKPNVGKSSLLNALLNTTRAIVTPVPGTTRDTIEETVVINNIPFIVVDTAGIRKAKGVIEKEGITRSRDAIRSADIIILMLDGSHRIGKTDSAIIKELPSKKVVVVVNKRDLGLCFDENTVYKVLGNTTNLSGIVKISALKGNGIGSLKELLTNLLSRGGVDIENTAILTNHRHYGLLQKTSKYLRTAEILITQSAEPELVSYELRHAMDTIGEITGKVYTSDLLDKVFSSFCIGK
ncbi:MAG: tRNA uridine-5-carboxymethylaminomethyl(34) synthesis GTPase MnmE [Elusimicrobiota bacterium]